MQYLQYFIIHYYQLLKIFTASISVYLNVFVYPHNTHKIMWVHKCKVDISQYRQ